MLSSVKNFLLIFLCVFSFICLIFLIVFCILEFLMRSKEVDLYVEKKTIKDLVKKFYKKLDIVSNQNTNEILECLKEMEELDSVYYVIVDNNYNFMSEEEYIKVKCNILNNIISKKINEINKSKNKKEKYKSLYDELEVCNKRYPLFKNVFFNNLSFIKNKI